MAKSLSSKIAILSAAGLLTVLATTNKSPSSKKEFPAKSEPNVPIVKVVDYLPLTSEEKYNLKMIKQSSELVFYGRFSRDPEKLRTAANLLLRDYESASQRVRQETKQDLINGVKDIQKGFEAIGMPGEAEKYFEQVRSLQPGVYWEN